MSPVIGTAGWSLPRAVAGEFAPDGTALERYASRFAGVEVNSSFHRPHRHSTWRRWGESVPSGFRFAVKLPKAITHVRKLVGAGEELDRFLGEVGELGAKLAVLLVQLPPKLAYDAGTAEAFFHRLEAQAQARVACEPRHASWFEPGADAHLQTMQIARVAADPSPVAAAAVPGGWRGLEYWRLHGSPVMYRSSYDDRRLAGYADRLRGGAEGPGGRWCMFDNTASSAATHDALRLQAMLGGR